MPKLIYDEVMETSVKARATKRWVISFYIATSIMQLFASVFIAWRLFSTKYPAHSDVFWAGVQCSALGVLSIVLFLFEIFPFIV